MTTVYRYLLIGLAIFLILGDAWYIGYTKGKQTSEKQYLNQQINQLQALISNTEKATQKAQEASAKYQQLVSAKTEADIKTTKELHNALKNTQNTRTQCVFDDHIMQQLDTARRRAANAANTPQLDGVLSAPSSHER